MSCLLFEFLPWPSLASDSWSCMVKNHSVNLLLPEFWPSFSIDSWSCVLMNLSCELLVLWVYVLTSIFNGLVMLWIFPSFLILLKLLPRPPLLVFDLASLFFLLCSNFCLDCFFRFSSELFFFSFYALIFA